MFIKDLKELEARPQVRQIFRYVVRGKLTASDETLMDSYENGDITDYDIEVLAFLYEVKVATEAQLRRRFPGLDHTLFQAKFSRFLSKRIVNCFALSDEEKNYLDDEALKFYTIDFSGIQLLTHFVPDRDIINWNARSLVMPVQNIKRILLATDFRIALETKIARQPLSYSSYAMYFFGRLRLLPEAQIYLDTAKEDPTQDTHEIVKKPFILLCYTSDDFALGDYTRINEQIGRYEKWFSKEAWNTTLDQAPNVLIVCDTAETANYIKNTIEVMAPNEVSAIKDINEKAVAKGEKEKDIIPFYKNVRVTCMPLVEKDLETCTIRYDLEKNKWQRMKTHYLAEKIK